MKSWKKQLNTEIDSLVPPLSEKVKNAPIETLEINTNTNRNNTKTKKWIGLGSIFATAMASIVLVCLAIFGVFSNPNTTNDNYIFTLEINPAVAFVTDEDGLVKSIKSLNEDADVVLSDENELEKMINVNLKDSIVIYIDNATKLGFLDASKQENAIRLSSNSETNSDIFDNVTNSIETYFKDNGIFAVVVKNTLSIKELCDKIGISNDLGIKNIDELTEKINDLSVFYKQNINNNATIDDIKNFYNNYILNNDLIEIVKTDLVSNISLIIENEEMLSEISNLYRQILLESPSVFMDYWTLEKQTDKSEFSYTLLSLMNNMSTILESYKTKFGKEITSFNDLQTAINAYSPFIGQDLNDTINNLSLTSFLKNKDNFLDILENIGLNISSLENVLKIPTSISEYLEQVQLTSDLLRNFRINKYNDIFTQNREKISDTDYENFIENIITKYGSLENYWNNK